MIHLFFLLLPPAPIFPKSAIVQTIRCILSFHSFSRILYLDIYCHPPAATNCHLHSDLTLHVKSSLRQFIGIFCGDKEHALAYIA